MDHPGSGPCRAAHGLWTSPLRAVGCCPPAPTWQNVQELGRRRDSLLQLQRNLPAVEAKLEAETAALEGVEQQQASLIGLLAGQDKVQTFLALLNQQALLSDVSIQRYEPMTTPNPPSATQRRTSRPTSGTGDEPPEPTDPLQELGYQKSSVALAVSGSYAGLQEFLQRMEALSCWLKAATLRSRQESKVMIKKGRLHRLSRERS